MKLTYEIVLEIRRKASVRRGMAAIVLLCDDYLAKCEELKGYKEENFELINYVTKLKAENLALLSSMETEYIERQARHIQELVEENLALKSSSYRVDQQDGE